MRNGRLIAIGAITAAMIVSTGFHPLGAQSWTWNNAGLNAMNIDVRHQSMMAQVNAQSQVQATERRSSSAKSPPAAARFGFVPSTARRRQNLARFIEKSRAVDPQGAAAMEQLFAGADVFAAFSQALAPAGLRIDDVADAYAVWWMSAWGAAHSDASTPSRARAQAVRAQAARALAATPEFARADDAAKQEFAEALLIQTALIDGMVEQYGRDPAMAPKVAASVRQGAKASGLDLDAMRLTETGFVPAK